ncbi:MAG TPA: hypothetical protein VGJ96_09430 [Gemmatimonadaceae bacterium]|jgi:hypothetical protein
MSGDVTGNAGASLSSIAALVAPPGANGLRAISAFGQGGDQNRGALNGVDFEGELPRDGLRRAVRLSTYDPRVGRFSGILLSSTIGSGSSVRLRATRWSAEYGVPANLSGDHTTKRAVASVTMSGPLPRIAKFANLSAQVSLAPDAGYSVLSQPATRAGGGSPSLATVEGLRRANELFGATPEPRAARLDRTAIGASAITRVDLTKAGESGSTTDGTLFYLLSQASIRATPGVGLSPWTAWSRTVRTQSAASQTTLVWAPYIRSMLGEARLSYSVNTSSSTPSFLAPELNVMVVDSVTNAVGLAMLGGASLGISRTAKQQWLASWDASWMTRDRRHRFNAFTDAIAYDVAVTQQMGSTAAWNFASLDALTRNHATYFERLDVHPTARLRALRGSVALSDVMTLSQQARLGGAEEGRGLTLQLGLRLDWDRGGRGATRDHRADSVFAIRTGVVSATTRLAPMLGFTWGRGVVTLSDNGFVTDTRTKISGGIRVYRGVTEPLSHIPVFQVSDRSAPRELRCTGDAVPPAPYGWPSTVALPDRCLSGVPVLLTAPGRGITAAARSYEPARSTRAELRVRHVVGATLVLLAGVSVAEGASGVQAVDRNLREMPTFVLGEEGARPVFAPVTAIDPRSGRISLGGSRVDSTYAAVLERHSDLGARFLQPTIGLTWRSRPGRALSPVSAASADLGNALTVSYALTEGRSQVTGFTGPTIGDPRRAQWSRQQTPQHAVVVEATALLGAHVRFSALFRATSGYRYTPMVSADVNGDGLANDAAFISPALEVARLEDGHARQCVRRQRGRIAALNSCKSGWGLAQNSLAATLAPGFLFGSDRVAFTILVSNPITALDRLVHGGGALRGWGLTNLPDPTLLVPASFDPARRAFTYQLRTAFGRSDRRDNYVVNPLRLIVDTRITMGPPLEDEWLRLFVRDLRHDGRVPKAEEFQEQLVSNAEAFGGTEGMLLLRLQEQLGLTSVQAESLRSIEQERRTYRLANYLPLATSLAARKPEVGSRALRKLYGDAVRSSLEHSFVIRQRIREVLTDEQESWLRMRRIALLLFMTRAEAERTWSGRQVLPQ